MERVDYRSAGNVVFAAFDGGQGEAVDGASGGSIAPGVLAGWEAVVLQSYQGGTFHIWLMKPDGTGLRQITTGHGDDREPRFSPDGKTVAFSSDRAFKGSYDVWTVDVASGKLTQITSGVDDEDEPAWSPDGKQLAYVDGVFVPGAGVGGVQGRTIVAVEVDTGKTRTLASVGKTPGRFESPSWSKDGKLAYVELFGAGTYRR